MMRRTTEMVPVINQNNNNNYNEVSDSKSDDEDEENLFNEDFNKKVEATPKTTINTKVVCAMKKLQALSMMMPKKCQKSSPRKKCQ